jgi:hypothetical protein
VRDSMFDSNLRLFTVEAGGIEIAHDHKSADAVLSSFLTRARQQDVNVAQRS